MVPVTVLAFGLAHFNTALRENDDLGHANWLSGVSLALATCGVFAFNYYEETPQKASIETF